MTTNNNTPTPSNDRIPAIEWRLAERLARQADENARFAALPAKEQRVVIVKDVLEWLRVGKLKAKKQMYLIPDPRVEDTINGYSCQACALGGIFACAVERGVAGGTVRTADGCTYFGSEIRDRLAPYFAASQLGLIEIAFEGGRAPAGAYDAAAFYAGNASLCTAAEDFNKNVRDARTRMERVMRNIIRHAGTFVPTDKPRVTRRRSGK